FHAHLEENTVKLKNPLRFTKVVSDQGTSEVDSTTFHHEVLKIILPSGEAFAWDIASAQYGYCKPIVPWNDFCKWRVQYIQKVEHFGWRQAWLEAEWNKGAMPDMTNTSDADAEALSFKFVEGLEMAVYDFNRQFTYTFDNAVKDYLRREYGEEGFSNMLKLPLEAFEQKQKELIDWVEQALQRLKDTMIRDGVLGKRFRKDVELSIAEQAAEIVQIIEAEVSRTGRSAEEVLRAIIGISSGRKTTAEEAKVKQGKKQRTKSRKNKARKVKAKD
ncbi:MAG: hypothetical protein Q9187_009736, partial [Circinaria calcarea]